MSKGRILARACSLLMLVFVLCLHRAHSLSVLHVTRPHACFWREHTSTHHQLSAHLWTMRRCVCVCVFTWYVCVRSGWLGELQPAAGIALL
jgi:hypothetical protein